MAQTDGERALERALGELGQREVAGPRANPRIVEYLAGRGDLPIWRRAGGDPRHGGPGHVGRLEVEADAAGAVTSVEGNHDNQVARVKHSTHEPDLVGWIARS